MKPVAFYYHGRVTVEAAGINMENFYWPVGGRRILFKDISRVSVHAPAGWLNSYSIRPMGERESYLPSVVWTPPTEGRIVELRIRGSAQPIGFTVRDGDGVEEALRARATIEKAA